MLPDTPPNSSERAGTSVRAVCIDACFGAKLLLEEDLSKQASQLYRTWIEERADVWVPELFFWEVMNVIRKSYQRDDLTGQEAHEAADVLSRFRFRTPDLLTEGLSAYWHDWIEAFGYQVSAYDAAYLATATLVGCDLWTADERLVRTVGDELGWVHSLGEFAASAD